MQFDKVDSLPTPVRPVRTRLGTRLVSINNEKIDPPVPHRTTTEIMTDGDIAMQPTIPLKLKAAVNNRYVPAAKVTIGLLIGIGLLLLVARFVNLPATIRVLRVNLTTPEGVILALLSGMAFLSARSAPYKPLDSTRLVFSSISCCQYAAVKLQSASC